MAFEHKIDSGSIFRNDDRESETHPHYKGSAKISSPSGEIFEVWVSGWINDMKSGGKYLSLKFNQKKDQPVKQRPVDFDEEMPF